MQFQFNVRPKNTMCLQKRDEEGKAFELTITLSEI
jgi:hypothetical protein